MFTIVWTAQDRASGLLRLLGHLLVAVALVLVLVVGELGRLEVDRRLKSLRLMPIDLLSVHCLEN